MIWVWACAYLNAAGWILSALHQLNAAGYAVVLAIGFVALWSWKRKNSSCCSGRALHKLRRRFRRPFPLAFLVLASMALLGGILYAPSNYDALAYRLPRILHWLDAGRWHWVHTVFPRLNTRACGVEWVSVPVIALLKTDRPLFLISFISFLLLPGLIFSTFVRLGVRRRVAWHWMWILPTAYSFLTEAGGIGNDIFAAPFVLAAVNFALRARVTRSAGDFLTAIVAAGMLTACKLSNVTLLLPWAIAILPSINLASRWPVRTAATCLLALLASVLPTAYENQRHTSDWTGMAAEQPGMPKAPLFKLGLNTGLAVLQNVQPPLLPWADRWNRLMDEKLPATLIAKIDRTTEGPDCRFHLGQMQVEENAGLGGGVCFLLLAALIAGRNGGGKGPSGSRWLAWVRWAPFVSFFVLLTQSNLAPLARLAAPYYGLLLPALLACGDHERVVKTRWWHRTTLAVFAIATLPLVFSPARPLFPVQTILGHLPHAPARIQTVYTIYRQRNDAFAPVKEILPGVTVLGMTTFDDPETSLWKPFGSRRVIHIRPEDSAEDLKRQGVEYVLVKDDMFGRWFPGSLDDWLIKMNAANVQTLSLSLRASGGPSTWTIARLH